MPALPQNNMIQPNTVQKYPVQPMMNQQPIMGQPGQTGQIGQIGQIGQPGQPGLPGQPMPVYVDLKFTFVQDPISELAMSYRATIRQQPEVTELLTGCESENRYHVFISLVNGMEKYLFKCKEQSTCCQRQCCPADAREFNMLIKHISNPDAFKENFSKYFAKLSKPYKCSCLCLARPKITGEYTSNNQVFGEVKEECSCCDPLFVVLNQSEVKYSITINCCQCGFCCRCSCSKYFAVDCIIREGGKNGTPVGSIKKRSARNIMELIGDADTYIIEFPPSATPEDKLSLIMAGLFIDYRYFESNAGNNGRGHRRRRY
jgi:hypothetical protein